MALSDPYPFTRELLEGAPDTHGVYALYDRNMQVIYYGRAEGIGVTIQNRLQSHLRGDDGPCTQNASYYAWEMNFNPAARESALIEGYKATHAGLRPSCNERSA